MDFLNAMNMLDILAVIMLIAGSCLGYAGLMTDLKKYD